MISRSARLARGWLAAGFATGLASASHALAGGELPQPAILLFSLAISGLICTALAGKLRSLPRLNLAVLLSQGIFHTLFSVACSPGTAAGPPIRSASHHVVPAPPSSLAADAASTGIDHASAPMLMAHLAAAALTVLMLRHGESAGIALLHALRLELRGLDSERLSQPLPPAPRSIRAVLTAQLPVLTELGAPQLTLRHRGPPILATP